jgi:hypothetical protein
MKKRNNAKEEGIAERNLLNRLKRESKFNRDGCSKYWRGVTLDHYLVQCQIVWYCKKAGWKVFTEVEFVNGGRADVVAINGSVGVIIEVLHTEKDERFEKKKEYYPKEFILMKVKTSDFDLETFCL